MKAAQPDAQQGHDARRWVKIRREHSDGMSAERFWCEVLATDPSGNLTARVDNATLGPGIPKLNDIIIIEAGEEILDELKRQAAGR